MTADDLARLSLRLEGTTEAPHFGRRAFRTRSIYATLAPGGQTATVKLDRAQQEHWCALLPHALSPVPNKWGIQGWTQLHLDELAEEDLSLLLRLAWFRSAKRKPSVKA